MRRREDARHMDGTPVVRHHEESIMRAGGAGESSIEKVRGGNLRGQSE